MLDSPATKRHAVALGVLFGVLFLVGISPSKGNDALPLDDSRSKEEKPDKEKPKEKKPITVSSGTAMMVRTAEEVTSKDKAGRRFSATLEANLMSGDEVVAKAGTQVYGQVVSSGEVGRGIVAQHSNLVLGLTDINIEGTMYPIQTGSYSEKEDSVILKKKSVVIPAGSILEFRLKQPLTVKKWPLAPTPIGLAV